MSKEKVLKLIKILSFIGIIVASYSLYEYYFGVPSDFCNINEAFNCYQVAKSGYSDILGVPIALFGMIGFGLIFTCAAWNREGKNMHKFLLPLTLLSLLTALGFLFYIFKRICYSRLVSRMYCVMDYNSDIVYIVCIVGKARQHNS